MKNKKTFRWSMFNTGILISQIIFVILKLSGAVDWSWGVVFLPIIFDAIWGAMILDMVYYINNKFVVDGITLKASNIDISVNSNKKQTIDIDIEKAVNDEIDNADVNIHTEDAIEGQ